LKSGTSGYTLFTVPFYIIISFVALNALTYFGCRLILALSTIRIVTCSTILWIIEYAVGSNRALGYQ